MEDFGRIRPNHAKHIYGYAALKHASGVKVIAFEEMRTIRGIPAHIVREGEGPALLLLHGWGCCTATWTSIWKGLAAWREVIAVDFPGFGESGVPAGPEPWGVPEYAEWTVALMEDLGIAPCDVLAHSFGTRVALIAASQRPELFGRLVFTGACGARLPSPRRNARARMYRFLRGCANLAGAFMPKTAARWREALIQRFGSEDYRVLNEAMRKVFVRVVNQDLREFLPRVPHETLLIWGAKDSAMPLEIGRIMKCEMPSAGLAVFDGAGHFAFLDQPARFIRVVSAFLGDKEAE